MHYRAGMIGGSLEIRPEGRTGPLVTCVFPVGGELDCMAVNAPVQVDTSKRKVFVVDDHPIVREGLAQLINREPDLSVAAMPRRCTRRCRPSTL